MCTHVRAGAGHTHLHAQVHYTMMDEPIVWRYVCLSNMCMPVACGHPLLAGVYLCMHVQRLYACCMQAPVTCRRVSMHVQRLEVNVRRLPLLLLPYSLRQIPY